MRDPGRKIAVFAVLVVAGLSACNTGSHFEVPLTPVDYDPCVLVTKADAEAILGQAVTDTRSESPDPSVKACVYRAKSQTSTKTVGIVLGGRFVTNPMVGPDHRDMWKTTERVSQEKGKLIQPVAGLGKDAFLESSGRLHVLTEKVILTISVDGFKTDTQNADAEKAFAQKALSRM